MNNSHKISSNFALSAWQKAHILVLTLVMVIGGIAGIPEAYAQEMEGSTSSTEVRRRNAIEDLRRGASSSSAIEAREVLLENLETTWEAWESEGRSKALRLDYERALVSLSSVASPKLRARAIQLQESGSVAEIQQFLSDGWTILYEEDSRDIVADWRDRAEDGSTVKFMADRALKSGAEEIKEFIATGYDEAVRVDERRKMYSLLDSRFEIVRSNVSKILQTGDTDEIHWYVTRGQFIDIGYSNTKLKVSELIEQTSLQREIAEGKANEANEHAKRARDASHAALAAMQRAKKAWEEAGRAAEESDRLAERAGELAVAASEAAKVAVEAAEQALQAQHEAQDALEASGATVNVALVGYSNLLQRLIDARKHNESINPFFEELKKADSDFDDVRNSILYPVFIRTLLDKFNESSDVLAEVAKNVETANGIFSVILRATNETSSQYQRVRTAFESAQKASTRAWEAKESIDHIIDELSGIVEKIESNIGQIKQAAADASKAADEALNWANVAGQEATFAGQAALAAKTAAQAAQIALEDARKVRDVSKLIADSELEAWGRTKRAEYEVAQLKEKWAQDEHARTVESSRELETEFAAMVSHLRTWNGNSSNLDLEKIRRGLIASIMLNKAPYSNAASVALEYEDADGILSFAYNFYEFDELYFRNQAMALMSGYHEAPGLVELGNEALEGGYEDVKQFVEKDYKTPAQVWMRNKLQIIKEEAEKADTDTELVPTPRVKAEVTKALELGTFEAFENFFTNGGFANAQYVDHRAYLFSLSDEQSGDVKVGAGAALEADRAGLSEFITKGIHFARSADFARQGYEAQLDALLAQGEENVSAAWMAAHQAEEYHQQARNDAAAAAEAAQQARWYAEDIKRFELQATAALDRAKGALGQAMEAQNVAVIAANNAEEAYRKVEAITAEVTINVVLAEAIFWQATVTMGNIQNEGMTAQANLDYLMGVISDELANLERAMVTGAGGSRIGLSIADLFRLAGGLTGVSDISACVTRGENCVLAAMVILPNLRLASLSYKGMRALVKGEKNVKSLRRSLDEVHGLGRDGFEYCENTFRSEKSPCQTHVKYIEVTIDELTPEELVVFQNLDIKEDMPLSEWRLENVLENNTTLYLDGKQITEIDKVFKGLINKMVVHDEKIDFSWGDAVHRSLRMNFNDKTGVSRDIQDLKSEMEWVESNWRGVGNSFQAKMAYNIATRMSKVFAEDKDPKRQLKQFVRVNRRDVTAGDKEGTYKTVSTGRPDVAVYRENTVVKYEFGDPTSDREIGHIARLTELADKRSSDSPSVILFKVNTPKSSSAQMVGKKLGVDGVSRTWVVFRFFSQRRWYLVRDENIIAALG